VPEGYRLTFSDEFSGTALDKNKWKTRYVYADGTLDFLNDERQRYRENGNHVVSDGTLKLVAKKTFTDGRYAAYESGMIRSTYLIRYGYLEARVKLPDAKGVWPAFWLNSDYAPDGKLTWPPEIDIFEYAINGKEDTPDMIHMGVIDKGVQGHALLYADPRYNKQWSYYRATSSLAHQWHTVGLLWNATSTTMYLDGKKIVTIGTKWVYGNGNVAAPAHILLNLAVGGSWAGRHGIDDARFPQTFEIDYVRAYKQKEGA
jgi:beta-glucanase (GH16 family)